MSKKNYKCKLSIHIFIIYIYIYIYIYNLIVFSKKIIRFLNRLRKSVFIRKQPKLS